MPKNEPLFAFEWQGKAVGVNDRYADRSSKRLNPEYAAFKESIRMKCSGGKGHREPPVTCDVFLNIWMSIDAARDSDSLLKPLFDGLEWDAYTRIGQLRNDNQVRGYYVATDRKKRGTPDSIRVEAFKAEREE
jgi:hypothetical protein